ncbi:N-acetylmuramoyl-L-alanine amidase CwlD [Pseudogracilibacillus sp. SE30717A]|uniref:N-acetylmuramoyl-L-alanine amidase CwlD n=1 Tax=Pseudogracilibacillus sp. SE30717A TaxID=3098293 RepID=UPI00300E1ACE
MKRYWKITLWFLGLIILLLLIKFPIYKGELMWRTVPLPLAGKIIVIDPGHGGPDGGAVGKDNTNEKEIALNVAKQTRDYLQQAGALVYLTREEDKDLAGEDFKGRRKSEDIRNRLKFIHEQEPDFFITIHLNSLPSGRWSGAQTFYYPSFPENKHLATMIQEEIIRNLENTNRLPLSINHVYLLKHAEVPGALVEIGFLSNDEELELLKDKKYQDQMSASIYKGIIRYVTEEIEENELKDE